MGCARNIVDTKSETAAGHDLPMLVGFALFQTWVTLCFFTPQLFPNPSVSLPSFAGFHVYECSLVVSAVALILCATAHRHIEKSFGTRTVRWALAGCASLGTLLIPPSLGEGSLCTIATIIASLLTGIASGLLNLAWCQEFAERGNPVDFTVSVVTSNVVLYILTNLAYTPPISPWIMLVVSASLPFATVWLLTRKRPAHHGFGHLAAPFVIKSQPAFVIRLCMGIFIISFADEFMRNYYLSDSDLAFYSSSINLIVLLLKVGVSVLLVIDIRTSRREDFSFLYRASFLLALVSALLLPYTREAADLAYAITNCGAFLFKLTVFLVLLELCARHGAPALLVFAVVRAVWSLALLFGSSLYSLSLPWMAENGVGVISTVLVLLVTIAYLFVFAPGTAGLWSLTISHKQAEDDSAAGSATLAKDGDGIEVAGTTSLDAICAALAEQAGLSARELDVLLLLARGRTTIRIEAELGISSNTVNTHVRHIFQKLDVHSRQELLDLIERGTRAECVA